MTSKLINDGGSGGGNRLEDEIPRKRSAEGESRRTRKADWQGDDWIKAGAKGNRPKPPPIRPSAGTPTDQIRSYVKERFNLNDEGRKLIDETSFDMVIDSDDLARKYWLMGQAGGFAWPVHTFGVLPKKIVFGHYNNPEIAKSIASHEAGHTLDLASRRFAGFALPRTNHDEFVRDSMRIAEWLPEMQRAVGAASAPENLRSGEIDGDELLAYVMEYVRPEFLPPSYIQKYLPSKYMNQGENFSNLLMAVYDPRRPLRQQRALLEEWERDDRNSWRSIASWGWDFGESTFDWKRNR